MATAMALAMDWLMVLPMEVVDGPWPPALEALGRDLLFLTCDRAYSPPTPGVQAYPFWPTRPGQPLHRDECRTSLRQVSRFRSGRGALALQCP